MKLISTSLKVMGHAGRTPGQGPYAEIFLTCIDGIVKEATYKTYGCPACDTCSGVVCALVTNRNVAQGWEINEKIIEERVGPLPRSKRHCYGLAVDALEDALDKLEEIARAKEKVE